MRMNTLSISRLSNQMPMWLMGFLLTFCLWAIVETYRDNIISLPDQTISRGIEYYLVDDNTVNLSDIMVLEPNVWKSQQDDSLTLTQVNQVYWLRMQLPSLSNMDRNWLLEVDYTQLDKLSVWFLKDDTVLSNYTTGDKMPFRTRALAHERFLFPVPEQANDSPVTVYIELSSSTPVVLPVNLWRERNYLIFNGEHSVAMGLFFGFMLAMALNNFFFFVNTRESSFLLYTGYVMSVAFLLFSMHGMAYKYFWPGSIWLQDHSIGIFANATLSFALLFIRKILDIGQYSQTVNRSLLGLAGLFLGFLLISLMVSNYFLTQVFLGFVTLVVMYIFAAGVWLGIKGMRVSRVYIFAWLTLLASVLLASLEGLQIIETTIQTRYLLMLGAAIETMLLALLLAKNYDDQAKQLLTAREHALEQEKQATAAKEETITIQKQLNEELEYKVQERTFELEITLRELEEKNAELEKRSTQDALTGINNRRFFDRKYLADFRLSRRGQTELALAMIDIDHFKRVNDTYGHLAGDESLRHVAKIAKSFLRRPSDEICRYGGEEFAILMPATDADGATSLLNRIRKAIECSPVAFAGSEIYLTMSAGITSIVVPPHMNEQSIIDVADKALYEAKQNGRNQVIYKPLALPDNQ